MDLPSTYHQEDQFDANHVSLQTSGAKVTLTGTVHSWHEYNEASRAAWSLPGVIYVDNRIRIE